MRSLLAVSFFALIACNSPETTAETAPDAAQLYAQQFWFQDINLPAYLDCAREQDVTLLQAHRSSGRRVFSPENSLAGALYSLHMGAVFIEMDVARTRDGVLILMHDDTIDRTTTGSGRVDEMDYADIARLDMINDEGRIIEETVPTLAGALDLLENRGVAQIDLKNVSFEDIAEALIDADAVDRSVVITYSIDDAINLASILPDVALSVGIRSTDDLTRREEGGVDLTRTTIWLGVGTGNPELDAALAERGIETSYGDFRGEREGTTDYQRLADNGAEVISVDNVMAASTALNALEAAQTLLENCPAAKQ